jgi:transposase
MIQITAHMRILAALEPVDFRKGIDGLAAVCRQKLEADPFSGALFVFLNKSRQALRVLVYDGQGFWLCHKRLSRGRFAWDFRFGEEKVRALAARQLQMLLWNTDPMKICSVEDFRPVSKNFVNPEKSAGHRR